jgi:hypothetical protein
VLLAETAFINRVVPISSVFPWDSQAPPPPVAIYRRMYKEYMLQSDLMHVLYLRLREGYGVDDVFKLYVARALFIV